MDSKKAALIRRYLGKTQNQLAHLLCVSAKAIQSFEQGWRRIPPSVERQLLMLLYMRKAWSENVRPCWENMNCPPQWRDKCIMWDCKVGRCCWFFSGTYCQGSRQKTWAAKMELCWKCEVFRQAFPPLLLLE